MKSLEEIRGRIAELKLKRHMLAKYLPETEGTEERLVLEDKIKTQNGRIDALKWVLGPEGEEEPSELPESWRWLR